MQCTGNIMLAFQRRTCAEFRIRTRYKYQVRFFLCFSINPVPLHKNTPHDALSMAQTPNPANESRPPTTPQKQRQTEGTLPWRTRLALSTPLSQLRHTGTPLTPHSCTDF